jgi:DNA repair exonuclease SbcCD ATPase subunit
LRILRLHLRDFAALKDADVEFGPGLNVLYGPNDLGKSTLVDAIRLALLLPQTSTQIEEYVPWTGGREPAVDITFETEPQRIWRVRKEFRKGGMALLQESKNGVDFDDVERARRVDGQLRDILRWGIPEPGGSGGNRGLPTSFLASALLSTQADVTAILNNSLLGDSTGSGKERIAAALAAVAQDPLFAALLRETQARRDEAYTDGGAKKTARGSPFRIAADRLREVREEKDRIQKLVEDSDGVEAHLSHLTARRDQYQEALAAATERLALLQRLEAQAADRRLAAEEVERARQEVSRIQKIGADVAAAEQSVDDLAQQMEAAEQALKTAQTRQTEADAALESVQQAAGAAISNPALNDTVARQALELRKNAAEQTARQAQQRIDDAASAQALVAAAANAERERLAKGTEADNARGVLDTTATAEASAEEKLRQLDLLERALDVRSADQRVVSAKADVDQLTALQARRAVEVLELETLQGHRATIVIPAADALGPMRRLDSELAGARGALNVGLVVTVTPNRPIAMRVKKDGAAMDPVQSNRGFEVEASTEVDIEIGDVASMRIRGGRREAQERVQSLEERWRDEVAPHLAAANVTDLDGVTAKIAEVQELETNITTKQAVLQSLQLQIDTLTDSPQRLREALDRQNACHGALGDISYETLAQDLTTLGAEPNDGLRSRRQRTSSELQEARSAASRAATAHILAQERARNADSALHVAVLARDAALTPLPQGLVAALSTAQAELAVAVQEQQNVAAELASLESAIRMRSEQIQAAVQGARNLSEQARAQVDSANLQRTRAITEHASQLGRLQELRRQWDCEDLAAAENRLLSAIARHDGLPVPERLVIEAEISAAHTEAADATTNLDATQREIERKRGALEQVGGAVARERLSDAIEAFELAEQHEREIEADYEAWVLLLDQMKQADAAQASHLGHALAPAIASRFEALTQKRYESIRLTEQLGTEGVVVAGALRPTKRMSVGTREQLSTLYRLSLAEYLSTTLVLDDQLVQSDNTRMDWFRLLLTEKAHSFQIIVFTCRPEDYLAANATVSKGKLALKDTDGGFVRAIDLRRALCQT